MYKLYTHDNKFIKNTHKYIENFTGIVVHPDGTKSWYSNGIRHRENGPAVEYPNGVREWWLNGKPWTFNGECYKVVEPAISDPEDGMWEI